MKSDGTIWIDTKIDESGMEDGFNRMRDGADDVATSFRNAGKVIENSFSGIKFNKTIENLKSQIKGLEAEFDAVSREFNDAIQFDDDKSAERLGAKRSKIYDRIARAREKLAVEVAAAAEKEAAAEEKASRRIIAAEEKESAKRKQLSNDLITAGNSASHFGTRLRSIVSGALVFNVISAGLRKVTSYFGYALMANNQFASAVYRLKGSLMVAFQPIYESVLPALITLINWLNVAVQAVARFFSILAGKDYKNMQKNAQQLSNTMNSVGSSAGSLKDTASSVDKVGDEIKDTGKEAKKAEKYLAGFDEINRIIKDDTDSLSDSLDKLGDLSDNLGDIGEGDFGLGEFEGPVFEDVELPKEWETAIDTLAMRFKDIFFEWDNLTPENIAEKLLTALAAVAGGLIGFALGGPGGALIGMVVGAGLGVVLSSLIFNGDGKLSADEFIHALVIALGIIGGGLIGFALGNVPGAAIGIAIGAALSIGLTQGFFKNDGQLTYEELEKSLLSVILTLGGAGIGFAIGGPGGALIGLAIGAGLSFILTKADITQQEGTITGEQLLHELLDILIVLGGTAIGFFLGGALFGGVGAAIGAIVGLALSFALLNVEFGEVEEEYDKLNKKVGQWSDQTTKTTEDRYIKPTSTGFKNLQQDISSDIQQTKDSIQDTMTSAATVTDKSFFEPMTKASVTLANQMSYDTERASKDTSRSWETAAKNIEQDFIRPTNKEFAELGKDIVKEFTDAESQSRNIFQNLSRWFFERVTEPIYKMFDGMVSSIISGLNSLSSAIASIYSSFNSAKRAVNSYSHSTVSVAAAAPAMMYAPTPAIPMLARGAVIPPNREFLAVLGDQRHGTNVEAPLETIQEAVALVMEDMIKSNLAGHEATVAVLEQILEAVLGIELDGETLSSVFNNYNRKMAVVNGG